MGITQQKDQELGVVMLQKMPEPEPSFATLPVTDPNLLTMGPCSHLTEKLKRFKHA